MTTRKRLKRLVRARAAKTGESYTSALRHFRDETPKERVMSPSPEGRPPARCSFCGKFQDQVKKIIAGPGVFICDECVLLCIDIVSPVREEQERESDPRPDAPLRGLDVAASVRQYVTEVVRRIQNEEGASTPLVQGIDVIAMPGGVRVDVHTPRPGTLIGRHGATVEGLRSRLTEVAGGHVALNIVPIRNSDSKDC
jgi:hypothetical protein